jgi:hypothetical protein
MPLKRWSQLLSPRPGTRVTWLLTTRPQHLHQLVVALVVLVQAPARLAAPGPDELGASAGSCRL